MIFPGGFGTQDELLEALTLHPDGEDRRLPGRPLRLRLLGRDARVGARRRCSTTGSSRPRTSTCCCVTDDPAEAVELSSSHYDERVARDRREPGRRRRARSAGERRSSPRVGVVLGSGLGGLADELEDRVEIPYAEIPGWPVSTAVGHAGMLVLGTLGGVPSRSCAVGRTSTRASPPIGRVRRAGARTTRGPLARRHERGGRRSTRVFGPGSSCSSPTT